MTIDHATLKPVRVAALIGLLLIPLMIVAGLLGANWDSITRSHQVKAAIVNLDEPVTVNGAYTPLGRQLTAELVDSDRATNLTWQMESDQGAQDGLASGEYAAAITIPADFSAAATSFGGPAADAKKAVVEVQTSPVAAVADATLGKVVAREAVDALNATLTSTYLDQVYIGFNSMGDQFQQVVDGADQLSDGVSAYADGVGQAADGAKQLSDGATQLSDGLQQMHAQTKPLPTGLQQLSDGLQTMKKQTKPLPKQVQQLSDGLQTMKKQTKPLPKQVQQLADGLDDAADGADSVADGQKQLASGVKQYVGSINQVVGPVTDALDNPKLADALDELNDHAGDLEIALTDATSAIQQIKKLSNVSASQLPGVLPSSLSCDKALSSVDLPDGVDEATVCGLYYQGLAVGIDQANQRLAKAQADGSLGQALSAAQSVAAAAKNAQLPDGAEGVVKQLKQLEAGGDQLVDASAQLADGTKQLASGVGQAADGTKQLAKGLPALVDGIGRAADGTKQLAKGLPALVDGIGRAADGTKQLADQIPALVDGIGQSADGARQLSDGVDSLSDGLGQAADNSPTLIDGAKQLADGLGDAQSQIPHYSDFDRTNLEDVVTSPVDTDKLVGTAGLDVGWASLLLALALWLGALATFVVVEARAGRLRESALSSGRVLVRTLLPGAVIVGVEGLAVALIADIALRPSLGQGVAITAIMVVAGVTFALVNQALVAWFRGWGRLVSVALAVIGATGMVTAASPGVFSVLRAISPLSPVVDAVRAVWTGSSDVALNVAGIVGWLAVGAIVAAIAVLRSRATTFEALATALSKSASRVGDTPRV